MAHSSYQVERLLDRLRRARDWLPWPTYRRWGAADSVRVSAAAERAVQEAAQAPAALVVATPRPPSLAAVRDARRFAPVVEEERERRAGSFMRPPYPDEPPPPHIPRLDGRPGRRLRPRPVGRA
jgi:hypothetical protein